MDIREEVKIGDLQKNSEAIKVVKPKFSKESVPNAMLREGVGRADTSSKGEEGTLRSFVDTASVEASRWQRPAILCTKASRERSGKICTGSSRTRCHVN